MKALETLLREQLGALGVAALLLLAGGYLFMSLALNPLESRNRMLDETLARIRAQTSADPGSPASARAQLAVFYGFFRRSESLAAWLRRIDEAGRRAGLSLPSADYQSLDDGERLTRYRITLPLKGSYVQVRAFLDRVLNEVPVASIDQVSFHRAEPDSDRVEAQVTLTLFLLKP